jgi:hypothetical protein
VSTVTATISRPVGPPAARSTARDEHGGPAARVDGQEARAERRRASDRSFDGLRDVVQLEVEEHGAARLATTDRRRLVARLE